MLSVTVYGAIVAVVTGGMCGLSHIVRCKKPGNGMCDVCVMLMCCDPVWCSSSSGGGSSMYGHSCLWLFVLRVNVPMYLFTSTS